MAIGDAAAAAGLSVVSSSQSVNAGPDDFNQKGDEIAAVMNRTSKLETRTAGRQRSWRFTRPATPEFDTFTSASNFAGLVAGSVPSAPAGDYLISYSLSLQSPAAQVPGTARLTIGSTNYDTRVDIDQIAQVTTVTTVVYYAGGTLSANVAVKVGGASSNGVNVYNGNSSALNIAYLGARV